MEKSKFNEITSYIFLVIAIIGLIIGLIYNFTRSTRSTSTPVEEIRIDSISKENAKLILEVNNLDSIKDAKVIEVKSLNNDSTLRLFYKLIGK